VSPTASRSALSPAARHQSPGPGSRPGGLREAKGACRADFRRRPPLKSSSPPGTVGIHGQAGRMCVNLIGGAFIVAAYDANALAEEKEPRPPTNLPAVPLPARRVDGCFDCVARRSRKPTTISLPSRTESSTFHEPLSRPPLGGVANGHEVQCYPAITSHPSKSNDLVPSGRTHWPMRPFESPGHRRNCIPASVAVLDLRHTRYEERPARPRNDGEYPIQARRRVRVDNYRPVIGSHATITLRLSLG